MGKLVKIKLLLIVFLSVIMTFGVQKANAESSITDQGSCGTNANWYYYQETETLLISGTGDMETYAYGQAPWSAYLNSITNIVIDNSITGISNGAFNGCNNVQEITLPFVGKSRSAKAYEGVFGYIFGYNVVDPKSTGTTDATRRFLFNIDGVQVAYLSGSGTPYFDSIASYNSYVNYVVSSSSSTTFVGYRLRQGTTTSGIWQYSCNNGSGLTVYSTSGGNSSTTGYRLQSYYYNIPSSIKKVTVTDATTIPEEAFMNCTAIEEINLNEGITSIEQNVFRGCTNLKTCDLPLTLNSIGTQAFQKCTSLMSISFPTGITSIPAYLCDGCTSLKNIDFSDEITTIGNYSFRNCTSNLSLMLPESLVTIGSNAFERNDSITEIVLPEHVTTINEKAFLNCAGVENIVFNDQLKTIGNNAFQGLSKLTKIEVPNNVESIGAGAFNGCNNVQEITLPFVGKSRSAKAYEGVFGYIFGYNVVDPKSTGTTDATRRFLFNIDGVQVAYLSGSGTPYFDSIASYNSYVNYVVSSSSSTTFVGYRLRQGTTTSGIWQYSCNNGSGLTVYSTSGGNSSTTGYRLQSYYYNIPSSIKKVTVTDATTIPEEAFMNCTAIEEINLNEGITSIEQNVFRKCGIKKPKQDDYIISGSVLIKYTGNSNSITIPDNVTIIAPLAFENNTSLHNVYLTKNIRFVGNGAFSGCTYATINIPMAETALTYFSDSFNNVQLVVFEEYNQFVNGNDTFLYTLDDEGNASIIQCTTTSTNITLPSDVDGHTVTSVGVNGIANCTSLENVSIPASISRLDENAFAGCTNLVTITIPATCTEVGKYAFKDCTSLHSVTLAEGVLRVDDYAFYNCTALSEIVIPDSCLYLGRYAFYNCTSLSTATIGIAVEDVNDYAFCNCSSLSTIVIGTSVKTIGDYALYNTAITRLTTPYTLISIGDFAVAECPNLNRVILRNGITTIGYSAFRNDSLLTTINVVSSITRIGGYAFSGCSGLTSFTLPAGLTEVEEYTFANCTSLKTVTHNGTLTSIDNGAFYNCDLSSFDFKEGLIRIGHHAFGDNEFTSVHLPDSLEELGDKAFYENPGLVEISIPDSLATVGIYPFAFNVDDQTATVRFHTGSVADNILIRTDIRHLIIEDGITDIGNSCFEGCHNLETVQFGNDVTNIGNKAFYDNYYVSLIHLPASVLSIGNNCFGYNSSLYRIEIPDSVSAIGNNCFDRDELSFSKELEVYIYLNNGAIASSLLDTQVMTTIYVEDNVHEVGDNAFSNTNTLTQVSIPDTITSFGNDVFVNDNNLDLIIRNVDGLIDAEVYNGKLNNSLNLFITSDIGENAFANSTGIVSCTISGDCSTIGNKAFENCTGLQTCSISDCSIIGNQAFESCTGLQTCVIDNCATIGNQAFENCTGLQTCNISGNNDSIGEAAFRNCNSLTTVTLDTNTTTIGAHAFETCQALLSMTLPETVNYIGEYAFYDCNSMVSVNIPEGVAAVLPYTFHGCSSLEAIDIPDTVESIGEYAYYGCSSATSLSLSDTCTTIGDYAFYNCKSVPEIVIPESVESIGDYAFRSCLSITEIELGDNIKHLGKCVFYDCNLLETATLGVNITRLEDRLFYGCVNLQDLWIETELDYIDQLALYGADDVLVHCGNYPYMIEFFEENGINYVIEDSIDYVFKGFVWDDDTAKVCYERSSNPEDTVQYDAHIEIQFISAPTCETDGEEKVIARYADHEDYIYHIAPMTGHNYGEPEYVWSDDNSTVTRTTVCSNDESHVIEETVNTTVVSTATCESDGISTYTATFTDLHFETQTKEVEQSALGHQWEFVNFTWNGTDSAVANYKCRNDESHTNTVEATVVSVTTDPTCEEAGKTVYTATVSADNSLDSTEHIDTKEVSIPATGHAWGEITYVWSEDNSQVTATRPCANDSAHDIVETVNTTSEITLEPTCTDKGETTYTAVFTNEVFEEQTKTVADIPAMGHNWQFIGFTWNGTESAVANYKCLYDANHKEVVSAEINVVTTAATCEENGETVYTVTVNETVSLDKKEHTESQTIEIPATGHTPGTTVVENEQAPTCTEAGSYQNVVYCTVCGNELSRETVTVNALGHDWGQWTVKTQPTCTEEGTEERTCSRCGATDTQPVDALGHLPGEAHEENRVEPECEKEGSYNLVVRCTRCNEIISSEPHTIPATGHTPGTPVKENIVGESCTGPGSYDEVVYCTVCNKELSRTPKTVEALGHNWGAWTTTKEPTCTEKGTEERECTRCHEKETQDIDALGHDWNAPTYSWSDDNSKVTATRTCNNGDHPETETVTSTSEVTKEATCTEKGEITYTGIFTNSVFEKQVKKVETDALGHKEADPVEENKVPATCTTAGSYDEVVYCSVCGEELSRTHVTVNALGHNWGDWTVTKEAKCEEAGERKHICVRCGAEETEVIEALQHEWNTPSYTWSDDYTTCTAVRTCKNGDHPQSETVTAEVKVTEPTCDTEGKTVYTAKFSNPAFETQTKEVKGEAATGHKWSEWTVTKAPTCTEKGEETRECSVCHEKETRDIDALGHIPGDAHEENRVEPSCKSEGSYDLVVRCTRCNEIISSEHKTIPSITHNWGDWTQTKTPTCTEKGEETRECTVCYTKETRDIDALGHKYGAWSYDGESAKTHTHVCANDSSHKETENCTFDDGVVDGNIITYTCSVCNGTYTEEISVNPVIDSITRVYGGNRFGTSFAISDTILANSGKEKHDVVILANGDNFADALAGSYLAAVKGAPIIITRAAKVSEVNAYIKSVLANGGTIYVLGGTAAVPESSLAGLTGKGYNIIRLQGSNRYGTNIAILEEAGIDGDTILIATGTNYADSLSASATGLPMLLVKGTDKLNDDQIKFLKANPNKKFIILGGTGAVSSSFESELKKYGEVSRIAGNNRFDTSKLIAEKFFDKATVAVLAYGSDFPDGLCGGPLANQVGAPLILTRNDKADIARPYTKERNITDGYALGGTSVLPDATVRKLFGAGSNVVIKEVKR